MILAAIRAGARDFVRVGHDRREALAAFQRVLESAPGQIASAAPAGKQIALAVLAPRHRRVELRGAPRAAHGRGGAPRREGADDRPRRARGRFAALSRRRALLHLRRCRAQRAAIRPDADRDGVLARSQRARAVAAARRPGPDPRRERQRHARAVLDPEGALQPHDPVSGRAAIARLPGPGARAGRPGAAARGPVGRELLRGAPPARRPQGAQLPGARHPPRARALHREARAARREGRRAARSAARRGAAAQRPRHRARDERRDEPVRDGAQSPYVPGMRALVDDLLGRKRAAPPASRAAVALDRLRKLVRRSNAA